MSKQVILFGAGSDIYKILKMLEEKGKTPICICDNNEKKWGGKISNIPIVSPDELKDWSSNEIVISASFFDAIHEGIQKKLGRDIQNYSINVAPFLWLMLVNVEYDKELLKNSREYIESCKSELKEIYEISDKITGKILDYIIKTRTENMYYFSPYRECEGLQFVEGYFYLGELDSVKKMTMLDIGAYTGDTMEEFFDRFGERICRYYAFEPQIENYEYLKDKVQDKYYREKVVISRKALGAENVKVGFGKEKSAYGIIDSATGENYGVVELETLDSQEIKVEGQLVIKMDVEGLEADVLKGAKEYIKKYRPYMAVCVYHRVQDIYEIPKIILAMDNNYSFILRSGVHTHLIAIPT